MARRHLEPIVGLMNRNGGLERRPLTLGRFDLQSSTESIKTILHIGQASATLGGQKVKSAAVIPDLDSQIIPVRRYADSCV